MTAPAQLSDTQEFQRPRESAEFKAPLSRHPHSGDSKFYKPLVAVVIMATATYFVPWTAIHGGLKGRSAARAAEAAQTAEAARSVQIALPTKATANEVVLPATIRPWQTTTLHARASGYLTKWNKDLGATVTTGEVLAEIETPELDQEVAEAEASALEAEAAVVQAQAELREAEAQLKVAESQRVRAQAEANLATSQLTRRERLLPTQAIAEDEFEVFKRQLEARNADVAAAAAEVARQNTNLQTRNAVIAAREATAQSRRANVERLKKLQAFKQIVAPFDGVVTSRTAEVGMLVTAGRDALFTIDDMSRVRVQVNVPQAYSAVTTEGSAAKVSVPESGQATEARVTRIAEAVDATSRTMLAEIEIANAGRKFQPGSYSQVTLRPQSASAAWTVPTNTVQMRIDGPHVAVVDDSDRLELRPVTLGRDLGNRIIVTDGIDGQERLVVNPTDEMRSGTPVAPQTKQAGGSELASR